MTIAIGYFGENSFVLAADRRRSRSYVDYTADVAKVFLSEDARLAIAAAGDYRLTGGLARQFVKTWNAGEWPSPTEHFLEEKAEAQFAAHYPRDIRDRARMEQPRNELLIFDSKRWQLYELGIYGQSLCTAHTTGFVPIGHTENTALFFSERYLGSGSENPIVPDLTAVKLLAAYTVTEAGKLNPSAIGNGVDIFVCDRESRVIEQVTAKELAGLRASAADLDRRIKAFLFSAQGK